MLNPYAARVDERAFLNLPGFHSGGYVVAYLEDTSKRELDRIKNGCLLNFEPRSILEIADCSTHVNLEFDLHSALARKNSFHKIDTLIAAVSDLRAGLAEEARLYRERDVLLRHQGARPMQRR
jgi:hypothetical protein